MRDQLAADGRSCGERWGFRGLRAGRLRRRRSGSAAALRAGLDFEPFPFVDFDGGENYTPAAVQAALDGRPHDPGAVDRAARRLLRTLFAYGFFDRAAYVDDDSRIDRAGARPRGAPHRRGAAPCCCGTTARCRSTRSGSKSLAVIGADGDAYKNGGGSSNVSPTRWSPRAQGIAARAGAGVDVRYDPGDDPARAAEVARAADAAVVVVADTAAEGADKPCLALDCGAATRPRARRADRARGGRERPHDRRARDRRAGADAVARQGRGASSRPGIRAAAAARRSRACCSATSTRAAGCPPRSRAARATCPPPGDRGRYPGVDDVVHYTEGVLVGYRWFDQRGIAAAFPFGHGLSYTRFALPRPARAGAAGAARACRSTCVNTGRRAGIAVPQLYLGLPGRARPRAAAAPAQGLRIA